MKDRPSLVDSKHHFNLFKQLKPLPINVQRENSTERRWTWNMRRQNPTQPQSSRVKDANMTNSAVFEGWLVTVSTAQERCKERDWLLHLFYAACSSSCKGPGLHLAKTSAPEAERRGLALCQEPSCLPGSAAAACFGQGEGQAWRQEWWRQQVKRKSRPAALKFLPVPDLPPSPCIPLHIQCWNQLLPVLLVTRKNIPTPPSQHSSRSAASFLVLHRTRTCGCAPPRGINPSQHKHLYSNNRCQSLLPRAQLPLLPLFWVAVPTQCNLTSKPT